MNTKTGENGNIQKSVFDKPDFFFLIHTPNSFTVIESYFSQTRTSFGIVYNFFI